MEDFVTHKQAIKLKELGFDWPCNHFYCQPEGHELRLVCYVPTDALDPLYHNFNDPSTWSDGNENTPSAPTLAQVQKWLREVKGLYVQITMSYIYFCYALMTKDGVYNDAEDSGFNSPEEAFLAGIGKALELLKEK